MMARSQITLEPETQKKAKQRAAQMGISFAEYIRRLVDRDLVQPRETVDPSVVFNLGDSGGSDIARDKEAMLGEAVVAGRRQERGST